MYGAVPPDAPSVRLAAVPCTVDWVPGLVTVTGLGPPPPTIGWVNWQPLVSLPQEPCSAYEPVAVTRLPAPPVVPGAFHAHLSAFSWPSEEVQPPAGNWSVMVSEYSWPSTIV